MDELVSVVMGLYNEQSDEAQLAIDSILNQTYSNLEFIIALDDPNNDELKTLLKRAAKKDSRVVPIFNEKNLGVATSINNAISKSNGEFIARMDGDDISLSNRLEIEMKKLRETNADVITTNAIFIDEQNNVKGQHSYIPEISGAFDKLLPIGCNIINPSILMKKSAFNEVGSYRSTYIEDYDLWLRFLTSNKKIRGINQNLIKYRLRTNGLTKSKPLYGFLAAEYVKSLYQSRVKTGTDNFSEEDFQLFLKNQKYDDAEEQKFINITRTSNKVLRILKLILNSYGRRLLINDIRFKLKLRNLS